MGIHLKMTAQISRLVTVEAIGEGEKDVIRKIAFFQDLPGKCPECGALVKFTYREPQSFKYWGLECMGPDRHATTLGQYADGDGLFYRHQPWESWEQRKAKIKKPGDEYQHPNKQAEQAEQAPDYSNEDLPF